MEYSLPKQTEELPGILCLSCGDIIVSWGHHDYKHCRCGKCMVDGGREYFRYGWEPESPYQVVTVIPKAEDVS